MQERGWQRSAVPYRGHGSAGDYLEQLRKERMQTTFLITIDSPHLTLETMRALLNLNDAEGISVEAYTRPRAEVAQEKLAKAAAERDAQSPSMFSSSDRDSIVSYIDKAILSNEAITIRYRSLAGNLTTREVEPLRWNGSLLIVRQGYKDGIRSFYVDGIEYVEGPAL